MCDHFTRELCKVVIAQICGGLGFEGIQSSALEALTDILIKYIDELGYSGKFHAELACRTESNLCDLRLALSDANVTLHDLIHYYKNADDVPFAKPVPPFPIQSVTPRPRELRDPPEPLPEHIPPFLPPFPDKHTYVQTPSFDEQVSDPCTLRKIKNKRKRQIEASLIKLTAIEAESGKAPQKAPRVKKAAAPVIPEFFNSKNPYLSEPLEPQTISAPPPTTVEPSLKYTQYMEEDLGDDKDRVQHHIDVEDDADRARKMQKCEKIFKTIDTDTDYATKAPHSRPVHQLDL